MPIVMYNKKTGENVKVYGFVQAETGLYGGRGRTFAVTYQVSEFKKLDRLADIVANRPFEITVDDLEAKLVPITDIRPLEI